LLVRSGTQFIFSIVKPLWQVVFEALFAFSLVGVGFSFQADRLECNDVVFVCIRAWLYDADIA
jgi:hypothetical protein